MCSHDSPGDTRTVRRILVVDDCADAADGMAMLVSSAGVESRAAYDGASGLRQVLDFQPDVVFLDITMPGIDGYETCRRIRRDISASMYVVALTGWDHDRHAEEAIRAGFNASVTKPVDPASLLRMLGDTLRSMTPLTQSSHPPQAS